MSISVKNSGGDWVQCAGQGRAEYGASTVRKGRVSTPAISAGGGQSVHVTFTEPMPDNDYEIGYSSNNNPWAGLIFIDEGTKTKNGFNYYIKAPTDESLPAGYLSYTAFKLYTDTEYNQVLNSMIRVKQVRIRGTDFNIASTTYGGWYAAKITDFYSKCGLSESENTIINVAADNNSNFEGAPLIVRDSSASNYNPYHTVGISSTQEDVISSTGYVEFKVFYINTVLGSGV